jgi:histidinol-phosphate aminotransferase
MMLFRHAVLELAAYVPGAQPEGACVKLNANENPYPPSPAVMRAVARASADAVRLYPDATARPVREAAALAYQVQADEIVVGNGSDDVLTMICRTFLDPGDRIAVVDPTYTLYETLAAIQDARTDVYPLAEDYQLPEALFTTRAKVTFLPNPNAQTGTLFPEQALRRLCEQQRGIVVIDEAYAPFAGVTMLPQIRNYGNLIVLRTLSKSHSLAGLRVGFGIARAEIIAALMKVKDSYNVNAVSQAAAIAALQDEDYVAQTTAAIRATREWFAAQLSARGWTVYPSAANFVLTVPPQGRAAEIMRAARAGGYLLRRFDTPLLDDKLRISIGTDDQMRGLLACLEHCGVTA